LISNGEGNEAGLAHGDAAEQTSLSPDGPDGPDGPGAQDPWQPMSINQRFLNSLTTVDTQLNKTMALTADDARLFDDIASNPYECDLALAMEARTTTAMSEPVVQQPFIHSVTPTWPFFRVHWHATRYSDGTRYPAWYGSPDLSTTVFEAVHHWLRFVNDSFPEQENDVVGERGLYQVECHGELVDLSSMPPEASRRGTRTIQASQRLGKLVHGRGRQGLLEQSPYRDPGLLVAIFRQSVLGNPRPRGMLRYRWNRASDEIIIEHPPGEPWRHMQASTLLGRQD